MNFKTTLATCPFVKEEGCREFLSMKSLRREFGSSTLLRKLWINLEGRSCEERVKKIRHNVAAPRKIIISGLLTASHLLNYSFVDSHSLCIHRILLKQLMFQLPWDQRNVEERWCFLCVFDSGKQSGGC